MKVKLLLVFILLNIFSSPISQGMDFSLFGKKSSESKGNQCPSNKLTSKPDIALTKGMKYYYNDNFTNSFKIFNSIDEKFNIEKKKENAFSSFLKNTIKVITNDNFAPYSPWIYEMITLNTMKGIDSLSLKNQEHVGVEFNRALVREQKAKDTFKREINKQEKKLHKDVSKQKGSKKPNEKNVEKTYNFLVDKYYSNLKEFKAYKGFLNPFTDYIAGIYFLNEGEYGKAVDLLKRCYGMVKNREPGWKYVGKDFETSFKLKNSVKPTMPRKLWIIFFNGKIGQRYERRFDVPLFMLTKKVMYTGLTLPGIKSGTIAFPYLHFSLGKLKEGKTLRLVNMDVLEKTEFKKRFRLIAFRAITKALIFTATQAEIKKGIGKTIVGSYQFLTNHADVRQWKNLPKEIQIASINLPHIKKPKISLTLETPNEQIERRIIINANKSTIVFVSCPNKNSLKTYKVEL